jgi:hypothetical protein
MFRSSGSGFTSSSLCHSPLGPTLFQYCNCLFPLGVFVPLECAIRMLLVSFFFFFFLFFRSFFLSFFFVLRLTPGYIC